MAWDRSIFHGGRSLTDRYCIHYLPQAFAFQAGMPGTACYALSPQARQELFFKYSPGLNEQAFVDGFV
jgi:hypothetical protein